MSEWISVDDRMPDITSWVLVNADGAVNCMAWTKRGWEDWTKPVCPNINPQFITHWMPIPETPEE